MLIYARLHTLFPGKNLYDMLIIVFGGVIGRVFCCLYIWYTLHLGSLVLRNFGEFSKTVALTSTPMLAPMLIIGLLCIWVVNAGMEVVGRSAKFLLLFTLAVIIVVQLLSIPKYEYEHLKPVLDSGWGPVFADMAGTFTFPFAEIVVFLGVFTVLPRKVQQPGCWWAALSLQVLSSLASPCAICWYSVRRFCPRFISPLLWR